jgi:hypothetical protein
MNREQFEALREWIKAIVAEATSHDSSDGGLLESVRLFELENEARNLLITEFHE